MTRTAALLAWMVFGAGCAGTTEHVLTFEPGEHRATAAAVRVDVVEARYAERQLTVRCVVVNDGSTVLEIDRAGILLDDGGLELPSGPLPGQPEQVSVQPDESASLLLVFPVAGHQPTRRTLGLWVLDRDGAHLPPIRVDVPGIRTQSA